MHYSTVERLVQQNPTVRKKKMPGYLGPGGTLSRALQEYNVRISEGTQSEALLESNDRITETCQEPLLEKNVRISGGLCQEHC